jgi:hypothetical protein
VNVVPGWIANRTIKLFQRIKSVSRKGTGFASVPETKEESYRMGSVAADGSVVWGQTFTRAQPLTGTAANIVFKTGTQTESATGAFYPYDHRPGGMLLVKEPRISWTHTLYQGRLIAR